MVFEKGFYWLVSDVEEPTIVYYYFNEDYQVNSDPPGHWGFGFNIAHGGGFLPEDDIFDDTQFVGPIVFTPDASSPAQSKKERVNNDT